MSGLSPINTMVEILYEAISEKKIQQYYIIQIQQ
jgi:hypothetical protein